MGFEPIDVQPGRLAADHSSGHKSKSSARLDTSLPRKASQQIVVSRPSNRILATGKAMKTA